MEEGQSASAEVEEEVELLANVDGFQLMPDRLYFRVFYCFCAFIGSIKFPAAIPRSRHLQVLTKTCPTTLSSSPHHTYFAFYMLKTCIFTFVDSTRPEVVHAHLVRIASAIVMCAHCNL